ncbi:hypothetical protein RHSIM_Rhsim03G0035000 [Rhododendron simsii]|uniref:Uncharacterized protein n=1 Tax=Rhododendron simsii TaxID=118357 RepID=A0A834H9K7_RHOSS|nr:hypothetical protein RHSIM_Rhsim03G0035000 [Rhododendron simsii]
MATSPSSMATSSSSVAISRGSATTSPGLVETSPGSVETFPAFTLETLHNLKLFYCSYVKNIKNFQPALFRRCCCCWFFLFSLAAGVFCFLQMKKRKEKSQVTHERKKQLMKLRLKAEKVAACLVEVVFQLTDGECFNKGPSSPTSLQCSFYWQ